MAKITKFDRTNLKELRSEIAKALASVETKCGIQFHLGNLHYSNNEFRGKITCQTKTPKTVEPLNLIIDNSGSLSTSKHLIGSQFKRKTTTYTIIHYFPGKKYCWRVVNERGKVYLVTPNFIEEGKFLEGTKSKIEKELVCNNII